MRIATIFLPMTTNLWMKFIAVVSLVAFIAPTHAEEVILQKTANPYYSHIKGGSLSIGPFNLYMTPSEVIKVIKENYKTEPRILSTSITSKYNGIELKSQNFVRGIEFRTKTIPVEQWAIGFTSPAVGNVVATIHREVEFGDVPNAPSAASLLASLTQKYGRTMTEGREQDFDGSWRFYGMNGEIHDYYPVPEEGRNPQYKICTYQLGIYINNYYSVDSVEDSVKKCGTTVLYYADSRQVGISADRHELVRSFSLDLSDLMTSLIDVRKSDAQFDAVGKKLYLQKRQTTPNIKF